MHPSFRTGATGASEAGAAGESGAGAAGASGAGATGASEAGATGASGAGAPAPSFLSKRYTTQRGDSSSTEHLGGGRAHGVKYVRWEMRFP